MTTVAYREGVMAADTAVFSNGCYEGETRKVFRLKDGRVAGFAGALQDAVALREWLDGDSPRGECPKLEDDCSALVVLPSGEVQMYDNGGVSLTVTAPYYAVGSGRTIVLGAMAAGATATAAVQIACRLDSSSREPIHVEACRPVALKQVA